MRNELETITAEISRLYAEKEELRDEKRTGFVWLYIRKG